MDCLTAAPDVLAKYFNSEIVGPRVPYAEQLRGICFRPVHYFCEGKTLSWIKNQYWTGGYFDREKTVASYPQEGEYNWQTTLKMVVLIVPGMVVGTIAAVVAYIEWWFEEIYNCACDGHYPELIPTFVGELFEDYELDFYADIDRKTDFTAPDYALPEDFDLNASHEALRLKYVAILARLTGPESWKDETVRRQFDELMSDAHKEMVLLFKDAAKRANGDPAAMAKMMMKQFTWSEENDKGPRYVKAFFYNSIGWIYPQARNYEVFEFRGERGYFPIWQEIDPRDEAHSKPFFTPGTLEYNWRRLYNAACALIDQYAGLKAALDEEGETRFRKCAARYDRLPSRTRLHWTDRPTC